MPDPNTFTPEPADGKKSLASSARGVPIADGFDAPLSFEQVLQAERTNLGGDTVQRSALCISGGGIRSATFALGALQGLADLGILQNFDYLSTVSGGGYIGSWLTAWKQRWNGLTTPQPDKNNASVISELKPAAAAPAVGPDPVQHLREYNNYLSPKLGFFSADTWTLVATIGRNMVLNWLVFIPLLMCGLMVPRIVLSLARLGETYRSWYVPWVAHLFVVCEKQHILAYFGGLFLAAGIYNFLRYLPGLGKQNHTQGQFLKYCFGFLSLAAVALVTTDAWFTGGDQDSPTILPFWELWLFIALSHAAGYLAFAMFQPKALKRKWEELTKKSAFQKLPRTKWLLSLLSGGLLTSVSTAGGAWLLVSESFRYLSWPVYVTLALPLLFLAFGLALTIFVGVTSRAVGDDDREWLARAGAWGLLFVVCWTGCSALALLAPKLLLGVSGKIAVWVYTTFGTVGGVSGLISTLAGLSSKSKAQGNKNGASNAKQQGPMDIAAKLAAPVFIVTFLTALGILLNWIVWKLRWVDVSWRNHDKLLENTRLENAVLLALLLLAFSWIAAKFIDINKFSLQAMYRSRLIRAYLGASNDKPEINKFTGFDATDNLQMKDLKTNLKPFHIVNVALNLVSGKRLAWQQRKAASFTISALHCGSNEIGYRPSSKYGGPYGLSLGTAVAISGAAASPNMGYHSSSAVTFIMTLFNARLGSWLGNPKQKHWKDEGPKSAFDSIIREALGLTNETSPYIYLSDGGHFENLALYEMVRRRCRYIVVLDGGCDPETTYEDLGNALRKIRIDQKISIEFKEPLPLPGEKLAKRCAVAEIHYDEVDKNLKNGYLIYIKPVILDAEPPDVTAYHAGNPAFPHESTGNQWFNESQTESYRMLGWCSINDVFGRWDPEKQGELKDPKNAAFAKTAINYLKQRAAAP